MGNNRGIATRTTVIAAVVLAALMLGVPSWNLGNSVSPADNAAAVAGDRSLRIGWIEFQAALGTLNPLLYTMAEEMMLIWPCYSTLLTRDVNAQLIGDLASSYTVSPDGLLWHFKLVNNARFYDKNNPGVVHPVTAEDVRYTFLLIEATSGSSLQSYFPEVDGVKLFNNIWTVGDYDLYIQTNFQYGPLTGALTSVPILPKYIWETQAWNWDNFDNSPVIAPIIGSGPFYYNLDGMPSTGVVELARNPTWYATEQYGWQLHTNRVVIRSEASSDSSYTDYVNGVIDIMMELTPTQYQSITIGQKFAQSTGFVYEYNLNQMTPEWRATNSAWSHGTNNQLLLDPIVKRAIAMSVDKSAFIDQVLEGLGSYADSLVPDVNPWHYWYGLQPGEDPDRVGRAPVGEEPVPYDPAAARALLVANGWAYDSAGQPATPTTAPLCKAGGTNPLQFRYWTLDSSPEWNAGATLLADMAWAVGVDIKTLYDVKNSAFMNSAWKSADYDMWLWDWMFSPTSEVSADVMEVLTSMSSWTDVFWHDPVYDALYNASLKTSDPAARMVITDEMQRIAYEDMGCQLIAYRKELYAASALGPDHWQNYGDWNTKFTLLPDQLYPWLYMQIEPQDNPAPAINSFATTYSGDTTHTIQMTAGATDTQNLLYRWFFGDGTSTGWMAVPTYDKLYTEDGVYTAYLAVKEDTAVGTDQFVTTRRATVTVIDLANTAPHNVGFTYTPSDPDSGTQVQFAATAIDDNGDPMTFAWDFDDGSTALGQNVVHQFTLGNPSYNVKLMVDDGHLGQAPRPVNATALISVAPNTAPTIAVPDVASGVIKNVAHNYIVTSSDPDARDVRTYTWSWDDGSPLSVTSDPIASHTYSLAKDYTLTVWVSDGTGLAGHNVSDSGLVHVANSGTPHAPVVTVFTASDELPGMGAVVTFTATATDVDGDVCLMTFDFGDGSTVQTYQSTSGATVTATHAYTAVNLVAAYVTAFDAVLSDTSDPLLIDVHWTFQRNLVAGWNLMSVPTTGFGYMANSLGLMTGDVVVSWNPATATYDKTYTVGVSPPFKNFAILDSTGYWVYCGADETLYFDGTMPTSPMSRVITVPAVGGWAIVGFNTLSTTLKASSIPGMYSGGTVSIVASYNPVTKTYSTWTPGSPPFKDFNLVSGNAYWVWFTASGTLTYNP